MINKFKIMSLVLMILTVSTASFADVRFSDIKGDEWYGSTAITLTEKGLIKGYPDGSFGASKNITVGEFVTVVARSIDPSLETSKTGKWYQTYVDKATQMGLIKSGEFKSTDYDRPITRGEIARLLVRKIEQSESLIVVKPEYASSIKDYELIDDSYKSFILKSYVSGLMGGYPNGEFKPSQLASRADSSVMIHRMIEPSIRVEPELPFTVNKYVTDEGIPLINGKELVVNPTPSGGITPYTDSHVELYNSVMSMLDEKYPNSKRVWKSHEDQGTYVVKLYLNNESDINMNVNFNFNLHGIGNGFLTIIKQNDNPETQQLLSDILEVAIPGQSEEVLSEIDKALIKLVNSDKRTLVIDVELAGIPVSIFHYKGDLEEVHIDIYY